MKKIGYYNGEIGFLEEMKIPMLDRAVYFGDGVYDVAVVRGGKPFAMDDHVDRFYSSMSLLDMTFDMPREKFISEMERLIAMRDLESNEHVLYWQASRYTAPRSHCYDRKYNANLMAYISPVTVKGYDKKLSLITTPDIRFTICNIKTLNLIPNVLASTKAHDMGCDEAVFIRDGYVTEGAHTSISILKNGRFITPPLSNLILPSVTRKHALKVCAEIGVPYEERQFTKEELFEADEVIIGSSTNLFKRASSIDGMEVGGKDAALFEKLAEYYYGIYYGI